jgi:hypothetical protein
MISSILVALMVSGPEISIFDSQTRPGKSWILVDDCAVEVKTVDIVKNQDKVIQQVNAFCGLNLNGIGNVSKEK